MSTLPNIDILPSSGSLNFSTGSKSGSVNSNDIFQSILDSLGDKNSGWVSSMYSDTNSQNSVSSEFKSGSNNINKVSVSSSKTSSSNKAHKDSSSEDLLVPASLQNQLLMFLENQGFSLKDINQVFSSSKDSNGLIQINKLLSGLSGLNSGNKQGVMLVSTFKENFSSFLNEQGIDTKYFGTFFSGLKNNNAFLAGEITNLITGQEDSSFIESSQITGVQQILFKMGLGAGDVKKIIEQSKNGNGELELGKLSSELNKYLSSPLSESGLSSLLSENNISISKRLINNLTSKTDIENLPDTEFKQNLETMLKEKGLQKEDIKSVMEGLDSVFADITAEAKTSPSVTAPNNQKILSILKGEKQIISDVLGDSTKEGISAFLKKNGSSDKDIKNYLDSLRVNTGKATSGQGENGIKSSLLGEKAYGLINDDQLLSTSDQGNLKLNLTELLKLAGEKSNAAQSLKSAEGSTQEVKQGSTVNDRSSFSVKGSPDLSGLNISNEREIKNIGKVNQASTSTGLPDPLPKIVDKMMIMIRTGEYKSRLQITPPDLGKLDIDLTVKNGHIQANLSTENSVVKEIIEANLNQLKQQLNDQGLTVDKFDVMVNLENGERNNGNTWAEGKNERGSGRNTISGPDNIGEVLFSSQAHKGLISDSQIDVHV